MPNIYNKEKEKEKEKVIHAVGIWYYKVASNEDQSFLIMPNI